MRQSKAALQLKAEALEQELDRWQHRHEQALVSQADQVRGMEAAHAEHAAAMEQRSRTQATELDHAISRHETQMSRGLHAVVSLLV